MASSSAAPPTRGDSERKQPNVPEAACEEAQKWIEAVTGKSFGDKDFRSGLENGILLCELLSAIQPGLVKKINRLPTPIAGLDNLSVFLRGCEELGLKGAQLFDPGDLQDTSIRANLKDSDCSRKLKNVLNTVFWLGKAARGCASYSGPSLNLKEFEGLLAQMKVESEEGGERPQKRGVRDSGYDCWDSERSESLSPPRHTRDNSLDSLDSFGSRSQHCPSPDAGNRGSGSDSEVDATGRRPDVRKDDMSARRTANSELRSSVPFNQFLPNRTNAGSYIPNPRRKPGTEEGEQRSPEPGKRPGPHHKSPKTVTWAPESDGENLEADSGKRPREMLQQKRLQELEKAGIKVLPAAVRYSSPPSIEEQVARSPSPSIVLRRENDFLSCQKAASEPPSDEEEEAEVRKVPDLRRDDLASRRAHRGPVPPKVHQFVPRPACSDKDRERWAGIRRASQKALQEEELSEKEAVGDLITRRDNPFLSPTPRSDEEEEEGDEGKAEAMPDKQIDDLAQRRAQCRPRPHRDGPMSFVSATMNQADMEKWKRLKMTEPSREKDVFVSRGGVATGNIWLPRTDNKPCLHYEQKRDEEEEEEDERAPDLQKDDMMARRTGVFHKQTSATVTSNRFLPLPASKRSHRGELTTDAAPRNKREVQAERSKTLNARAEHQQPRVPTMEPHPDTTATRGTPRREHHEDEDHCDENDPLPDLEKDDMTARRSGAYQKQSAVRPNQPANQFLPVPGSIKYRVAPVSAMKPLRSRPEPTEKVAGESSVVAVRAEPRPPLPKTTTLPTSRRPGKRPDWDGKQDEHTTVPNPSATSVGEPVSSPPPASVEAQTPKSKAAPAKQSAQTRDEEEVKERRSDVKEEPQKKPLWLDDEDLPPMIRRVAFMSEETESVSMSDILNEDEVGYLPPLSQSRHERMHEQNNNFTEEEDHWQDDLARWKNRRRSASQELIKKEEERKKLEKRLKEEASDGNKRKSIKTYREIVEEKERREAELCIDYRNAATPEEAAVVLQRYALRFTISDATLDSLKLPRSTPVPDQDPNHVAEPSALMNEYEKSEALRGSEPTRLIDQTAASPKRMATEATVQQDPSACVSPSCPAPGGPGGPTSPAAHSENVPPQQSELQSKPTESRTSHQKPPPTRHAPPPIEQARPRAAQPAHALPSPPVTPRPVPLLAAKPYCQPGVAQPGHKPFKMDGLVRVNGEDVSVSAPATSARLAPRAIKDVPFKPTEEDSPAEQPATNEEAADQAPPPQTEKPTPSPGSAISSLIGGRNCVITTTIVTELTQTVVEPHQPDAQSNGQYFPVQVNGALASPERFAASPNSMQEYSPTVTEGLEESGVTIETPMLNLAKRVNHWVWDPNEERKRLESWQQEQERLLQEQYQREQEKLKREWEKAQLEVEEEERKHNEEERRILDETVTHLTPAGSSYQHSGHAEVTSSSPESNTERGNAPLHKNGQRIPTGDEDQHASKLHFLRDSSCDGEPSQKQELWKTASLDRNPQLNQAEIVKRCVSGKRLCSGCSQPLGKGAAMIIDTLGLFFHMQCFKCGACKGQLGDATAGTDVRIRNGLLSCYECYIASRGRGQPTTL
ncbi:LIM and calponin homology domains-containing protein 1-like [Brachionichthys hirsutus]|uniref:LIM and calponin homology domains-containing protein 1-like n=1 Tax=Brachionichthys hirsutus TaxID=412623 RepID=UPI00360465D6